FPSPVRSPLVASGPRKASSTATSTPAAPTAACRRSANSASPTAPCCEGPSSTPARREARSASGRGSARRFDQAGERVTALPAAARGVGAEADEGRFVVEGPGAVGADRGAVGAARADRVLAHGGGATPEREGGDQARRSRETGAGEQGRAGDRLGL